MILDFSTIGQDKVVSLTYTLKLPTGEIVDQRTALEPLLYLHGHGNIVPGLERHLVGKRVGDMLDVVVPPSEAYGERNPAALQQVPRGMFPAELELQVGAQLAAQDPNGNVMPFWVVDVGDERVVIDFNHPLAGVPLHFEVTVLDIRSATAAELSHGHSHGPGGHH
jgi:FKBP-type peptidyl-prolyl cis-trans isomerase SlyD